MLRRHYVPRSEGELVYSSPPTITTYVPMLLNLLVYIITFALWMYLDSAYYGFGSKIITPLTGAMWVVGAVFALILPSQREEIIRHTKWFILGYVGILFLYRYVIIAVSGVSADNRLPLIRQLRLRLRRRWSDGCKTFCGSLQSHTRLRILSFRQRKFRNSSAHAPSSVRQERYGMYGTIPNHIKRKGEMLCLIFQAY